MAPRLKEQYNSQVRDQLKERFGYQNSMAIPKLEKITVSMGMGDGQKESAKFEQAEKWLGQITGQKPRVCKARKSVSNFQLREGYNVGLKVTLRGPRMWEFLDRLISLAIPRVRDFRGLNPSSFDGRGNYNMGLDEQTVFPEIDPASIGFNQGMNIAITTTAESDEEARELLTQLGMPYRRDEA
ncbi:MAG: 50S ribosomal protein L5 [Phycisphaerae bacterium]